MNMPLLDIQPRTLKFVVDLKKQSSCVVELTNTTHHYVAFKVKTTSPKKYCVRPNVGVVAPKSSCEFTVIMQAFKEPPPDMVCKDKFLIQSTAVPAETTDEDITASMFSKVEGKHIEENKLRVTLVPPSDSPELSPVNGTPKQDAVFEDSILKDRLYSQSETLAPPQYEGEIVKEPRMVGHGELKAADDAKELKPPKMGAVDLMEDLYAANDLKATKGGYDTSRMAKETEFDPIRSHKDADDRRGIKATYNLDAPMKKGMDVPRDQGFINGITSANSVCVTYLLRAFEARDQNAINNPVEASIIAEIVEELVNNGVDSKDIGIITPYNSQASLIQHALSTTSVEIHTIDKYQGRDKDCILVSFVRSREKPRSSASSLLGDWHRINVALTRAKKKLIMVGSQRTLSRVPLLMLLIKKVTEQSGILTLLPGDLKP